MQSGKPHHTWNAVPSDVFRFTLSSSSKASGFLTLTQASGAYYRLRAVVLPSSKDVTNVSYYSGWFYFKVVR
ncbi:MAG: hypothetical protein JWM19_126 [Actinomycetia bacterium]|nr:hypothetical protein [Actinomycetes bacterium]